MNNNLLTKILGIIFVIFLIFMIEMMGRQIDKPTYQEENSIDMYQNE